LAQLAACVHDGHLTVALSLVLTAPDAYSLDALLGLTHWWTSQLKVIVLGTGLFGGVASLALRRASPAVAHA
jgi:hypothetical protein